MSAIGVIGCGDISARYIRDLRAMGVHVAACASRSVERARVQAQACGIEALEVDELVERTDIDLILNLTSPLAHADISSRALRNGKHVYSEKPLAATREEAAGLLSTSYRSSASLACAPATHLGPAQQTIRGMIDSGELGEIVGASATIAYSGPDQWHESPEALFGPAAGPLFDMGVYAINALVFLLGSVSRVVGFGRTMRKERVVVAGARAGTPFNVQSATHVSAILEFESGATATLLTSFETPGSRSPGLEIHGSAATLAGPGCSFFDGDIRVCRSFGNWREVDRRTSGWSDGLWPIGVLDFLASVQGQGESLCKPQVAFHVLDIMTSIEDSIDSRSIVDIQSRCQPVKPLPLSYYETLSTVVS